jgi:hypothetical protein
MRHGEILTLIKIPYLLNYPLLLGSWQGQALVSLHKLTKTEGLQILDGVGLLETFYARGYLPELRTCFRQLKTHNIYSPAITYTKHQYTAIINESNIAQEI